MPVSGPNETLKPSHCFVLLGYDLTTTGGTNEGEEQQLP
jgi:hypothetical protein